jgi:hypothetical protein
VGLVGVDGDVGWQQLAKTMASDLGDSVGVGATTGSAVWMVRGRRWRSHGGGRVWRRSSTVGDDGG